MVVFPVMGWKDEHDHERRRHTPEQAVRKIREGERLLNEGGELVEVLRQMEVSEATWNRWRAQYDGMKADEAKRLKQLEGENQRLKKLVAEQALDIDMLKELAEGNFWARVDARPRQRCAPRHHPRRSQQRRCPLVRDARRAAAPAHPLARRPDRQRPKRATGSDGATGGVQGDTTRRCAVVPRYAVCGR